MFVPGVDAGMGVKVIRDIGVFSLLRLYTPPTGLRDRGDLEDGSTRRCGMETETDSSLKESTISIQASPVRVLSFRNGSENMTPESKKTEALTAMSVNSTARESLDVIS